MTSGPPPGGGYEPAGLDPLSRRLLQVAGGLSVLLIAVVVFSLMHGGGESPLALNPIARAAESTEGAGGARISVRYLYTYPDQGRTVAASGEGAFNGETQRTELSIEAPSSIGNVRVDAVGEDSTVYMRSDAFQGKLPDGAEWMRLDLGFVDSGEAGTATGGMDLKAQLDQLRAVSGGIQVVGHAKVRGVKTTRYRTSFDLADYAAYLHEHGSDSAAEQYEQIAQAAPATNEVEVWIDSRHLLRRMRIATNYLRPESGQVDNMVMTMDFFDFGVEPDIQLPDSDSVFDATSLVEEKLGLDS